MFPSSDEGVPVPGQQITGPLTSWQFIAGQQVYEYLAGVSPEGDLIVFRRVSQGEWKVTNVSHMVGQKIATPLTNWQKQMGQYVIENLAGVSPEGDLIVFSRSPERNWFIENVSLKTGAKIASPPTSWQVTAGQSPVEYLAGINTDGNILLFWRSEQQEWQALDLTEKTGQKASCLGTGWQVPDWQRTIENVSAQSPEGDVIVLKRSFQRDWKPENISKEKDQRKSGSFPFKLSDT